MQFRLRQRALPPDLGAAAPMSVNRTLATESDIQKLTSDFEPDPALYQITVADAVASGRPTVVAFNTPQFCQTSICAPVLESIKGVYGEMSDSVILCAHRNL